MAYVLRTPYPAIRRIILVSINSHGALGERKRVEKISVFHYLSLFEIRKKPLRDIRPEMIASSRLIETWPPCINNDSPSFHLFNFLSCYPCRIGVSELQRLPRQQLTTGTLSFWGRDNTVQSLGALEYLDLVVLGSDLSRFWLWCDAMRCGVATRPHVISAQ